MTKDNDLIRYLLGEASEEEQARLEQEFFADDEAYQQLLAIEDELRYEYAQGGLTARQRKQFEQRYLTTPAQREKVALAKSVLSSLGPGREQRVSWWSRLFLPGIPRLALVSTAVVAMSGASLLLIETMHLRDEVSQLQAARVQDQRDLADARKEKAPPTVFSFALVPGLTRDAGASTRIAAPGNEGMARIQLERIKGSFAHYRVELQTVEGTQLWSQEAVSPALILPARLLVAGDYEVIVNGITDAGNLQPAGDFYFTVVRR